MQTRPERRAGNATAALVGIALALAYGHDARAETVIRVTDGDSIVVATAHAEVKVRLAWIDAPEHDQPHGAEAHAALEALVKDREVRLELVSGDAYRRIVAAVHTDEGHVNERLARAGHAQVNDDYDPPQAIRQARDEARTARRGLWAAAAPIAPWKWRKMDKTERAQARSVANRSNKADDEAPPWFTREIDALESTLLEAIAAQGARRAPSATTHAPGTTGAQASEATPAPAHADAAQGDEALPKVDCGAKRYCKQMESCAEARAYLGQCGRKGLDRDRDGTPCEALCRGG